MISRSTDVSAALRARRRQRGFLLNPYRFPSGPATDPYFANVVFGCHFDGTNGSQAYVDSSSHARTISESGTNSMSTAQFKFGPTSLALTGGGGHVSFADHASVEPGSSDWTWDLWARSGGTSGGLVTKGIAGGFYPVAIGFVLNVSDIRITVRCSTDGTAYAVDQQFPSSGSAFAIATWAYISVARSGSTIYVSCDGVSLGSAAISGSLHANSDDWYIGRTYTGGNYSGHIDDARFTIGTARSGSVPSAAFPDS